MREPFFFLARLILFTLPPLSACAFVCVCLCVRGCVFVDFVFLGFSYFVLSLLSRPPLPPTSPPSLLRVGACVCACRFMSDSFALPVIAVNVVVSFVLYSLPSAWLLRVRVLECMLVV